MKVRWTTDEETTSRIQVFRIPGPGLPGVLVFDREEGQFKKQHVMVARNLRPELTYRTMIVAKDPGGNVTRKVLPDEVMQDHLFDSVHLTQTQLQHTGVNLDGTHNYTATFTLVKEDGLPLAGATVEATLVEWATAAGSTVKDPIVSLASNASGVATATFTGLKANFSPGTAEIFVRKVIDPSASHRLYFKSLDGQFGFWGQAVVP
jgi:hypothetical protein